MAGCGSPPSTVAAVNKLEIVPTIERGCLSSLESITKGAYIEKIPFH
jgi:hypothetical protein